MNSYITTYLEKHGGKRTSQILVGLTVYEAAKPTLTWLKNQYNKEFKKTYTLVIPENDSLYGYISILLPEQISDVDSLFVTSNREDTFISYDSRKAVKINMYGHNVWVSSDKTTESSEERNILNGNRFSVSTTKKQLTFTMDSIEARDAAIKWIDTKRVEYWEKTNINEKSFIYVPRFSDWSSNHAIRPRSIDSVFGKEGQIERIRNDLDKFFSHEQQYIDLGIPYHRGYIFYGPPGTGKSSIAQALASHFNLNIYYLPLASIVGDTNLIDMINEVPNNSVLLIEDIDVYATATERESKTGRDLPTLAGLLNSLDGVCTPHGLITMMTTNSLKSLDAAILRPGRADVKEEFGMLDEYQINAMTSYMEVEGDFSHYINRSPAELMECIKTIKLQ